jgi:hypothetical protein
MDPHLPTVGRIDRVDQSISRSSEKERAITFTEEHRRGVDWSAGGEHPQPLTRGGIERVQGVVVVPHGQQGPPLDRGQGR